MQLRGIDLPVVDEPCCRTQLTNQRTSGHEFMRGNQLSGDGAKQRPFLMAAQRSFGRTLPARVALGVATGAQFGRCPLQKCGDPWRWPGNLARRHLYFRVGTPDGGCALGSANDERSALFKMILDDWRKSFQKQ